MPALITHPKFHDIDSDENHLRNTLHLGDGTVDLPAYSFKNAPSAGMYLDWSNCIALTAQAFELVLDGRVFLSAVGAYNEINFEREIRVNKLMALNVNPLTISGGGDKDTSLIITDLLPVNSKIVSFQNSGVEKAYISKDGTFVSLNSYVLGSDYAAGGRGCNYISWDSYGTVCVSGKDGCSFDVHNDKSGAIAHTWLHKANIPIMTLSGDGDLSPSGKVIVGTELDASAQPSKLKIFTQELEPDIPDNTTAIWRNTSSNKTYILLDVAGAQYKVEAD